MSKQQRSFSHGLVAAAAAVLLSAGAPAHAALTYTNVACDGQGTDMSSLAGYVGCSGSWSGNNNNQVEDVASQISDDWGLSGLVTQDVTAGNSGSDGTLSFANQTGTFVVALKAGNAFSLFAYNGGAVAGGISSIAYDTLGVGFFSGPGDKNKHFGQDLSHASLYSGVVVPAIPEPETYALMLAGLGTLGFIARRRKQQ